MKKLSINQLINQVLITTHSPTNVRGDRMREESSIKIVLSRGDDKTSNPQITREKGVIITTFITFIVYSEQLESEPVFLFGLTNKKTKTQNERLHIRFLFLQSFFYFYSMKGCFNELNMNYPVG